MVPANFGPGCDANGNARLLGPCGDTFEFWLKIKDDVIVATSYTTDGCFDSIICGSAVAMFAVKKSLDFVINIDHEDVIKICEGFPSSESGHCILLGVNTLKKAVENYYDRQAEKVIANTSKISNNQSLNLDS